MNKAFTLIELLVVISIIALFTGVGYTNYTKNLQSKELDKQVDAFVNVLTLTRNRAISRDISYTGSCTGSFGGYQVQIAYTTNQYRQQFICKGATDTYIAQGESFKMNQIIFKLSANKSISFYHPYGCLDKDCITVSTSVTIKNPANSTCKDVTIDRFGRISVGASYVSSC